MKKFIFTLGLVLLGLSAMANTFTITNQPRLKSQGRADMHSVEIKSPANKVLTTPSRAEASDEVFYSLAGDPELVLNFNGQIAGMQEAMAFQIEPDFLSGVTDGEITEITFYTGTDKTTRKNSIPKATVFITDNLSGDFLYTQEVTLPSTAFTKVNAVLDTPFAIPADSKVYVGVYVTLTDANNMPIVVDYLNHTNDKGGWVAYRSGSTAKWTWNNTTDGYGFVCVGATIKANNMPKNSVSVLAVAGQPLTYANEPFSLSFMMQNNGANNINTITVEFGIEGETLVTENFTLEQPWAINQILVGSADLIALTPTKSTNVVVTIKALDGEANTAENSSGSYSISVVPQGKGLPRNVVIEEFTSTSCSFCPVGYTAMEQIHENYNNGSIIPVCVHVNYPGSDKMTAATFNNLYLKYQSNGVPTAVVNRNYVVYPYYDDLVETAEQIKMLPGLAQVTAEAQLDRETSVLTVDTETKFAFDYTDGDKNFILSYAITEDEVGPYTQKNGYSGATSAVPGGWEKKPATVELIYNDVARQLDKYAGITGSVPAEITAGESYKFSHDVKLNSSVGNLDKINLVVYLVNRKTGEIENAYTIKNVGNGGNAGIEAVTNDNNDAPVEYFNLQGLRIDQPSNGIYIRRQGSKTSKVLINQH